MLLAGTWLGWISDFDNVFSEVVDMVVAVGTLHAGHDRFEVGPADGE